MEKTCLKCQYTAEVADDPLAECPKCGAIYSRVESAVTAKQQHADEARRAADAAEAQKAKLDAERAFYAAKGAEAHKKRQQGDPTKGHLCATCGQADAAVTRAPSSLWVEIGVWLFAVLMIPFGIGILLLVGALGFSLYRLFARRRVCRACKSTELVPADSPRGRELASRFHGSGAIQRVD